MTSVPQTIDDLERRLVALEGQLPAQRSADESDAISAMHSCVHELRRLIHMFPAARLSYVEAQNEQERDEALVALRRLIHDLRTPAGVLYTYLRLITGGVLFAQAGADQRNEAASLTDLVREVRDQMKAEV